MARTTAMPKQPDRVSEALRDQSASQHRQQQQVPFLNNGRQLTGIEIGAASIKETYHGLGRQPKGWIVTDVDGLDGRISRTAWSTKSITLRNASGATVTVAVWIY